MTKSYWQNGDVTDAFQLSAEVKGTLMIERYERPTKVNEKLDVGYLLRGIIVGQAGI